MSEGATEQKSKATQSTGKASAPSGSKTKSESRTDGKNFGDACVALKIVNVQLETQEFQSERPGQKDKVPVTKLVLVVPKGANIAKNNEAFVDGVDATIFITSVDGPGATAHTTKQIEASKFTGKTLTVGCKTVPRAKGPVEAQITTRTVNGNEDVVVTIDAGSDRGITTGMKGHVKGSRALNFKILEVWNAKSTALLKGGGSENAVVIND